MSYKIQNHSLLSYKRLSYMYTTIKNINIYVIKGKTCKLKLYVVYLSIIPFRTSKEHFAYLLSTVTYTDASHL